MTLDPRTPAEIEYDRTALSTRAPAQPERSPMFYELKNWIDSHFDAEEQAEQPVPTLPDNPSPLLLDLLGWAADHLGVAAPTHEQPIDAVIAILEEVERDEPADTLLLTFPDGARFSGTHNADGSHSCAHLEHPDGQFYCGADGVFSGDWAGFYFEELTMEQALKLQDLLNDGLLLALRDQAEVWCKE